MKTLIVLHPASVIIISTVLLFLCISVILYIKQYKIQAESKRLIEESERLSKLASKEAEEKEKEKPYEDFTSGHIY
ncbi:hypothetical protein N7U66_02630 [Lacinutrix neustonica]|uniref:Uncharacterized protein n=1 Tax=Lacinutrix neustonica TaxID=2980107 RepID=A0A9E8MWF7_9FLAO|nr:hypothetical protein [Lacinutrix neustonica]WAC02606.1 hypothetical protein N7U66_02630 [Lacinutrix neustonica]